MKSITPFTVEDILRKKDPVRKEGSVNHLSYTNPDDQVTNATPFSSSPNIIVAPDRASRDQRVTPENQNSGIRHPVTHSPSPSHHANHETEGANSSVRSHNSSPDPAAGASCYSPSLTEHRNRGGFPFLHPTSDHHQRTQRLIHEHHHHHAHPQSEQAVAEHRMMLMQQQQHPALAFPSFASSSSPHAPSLPANAAAEHHSLLLHQQQQQQQHQSHYYPHRQAIISGVCYGNPPDHRIPGASNVSSIMKQASSVFIPEHGSFAHHSPSSPLAFPHHHHHLRMLQQQQQQQNDHQSLHELNLLSSSSGGRSSCGSTDLSQDQQVHPVFGISRTSGITYSWISPPKSQPRKRTVFSRIQRNALESKFQAQKYISKSERIRFARELGLKDSQVKVWFINRRTKWRNDREKKLMCMSGGSGSSSGTHNGISKSKAGSLSSSSTTSSTCL